MIETRLGKNLLHLACQHHVYKIVVGDVFKHCFGPSSGPDIGLFHEFWPQIVRSQFLTANNDPVCIEVLTQIAGIMDNAISFTKQALLSSQQTRDDYRELLELTAFVLFLGDSKLHHVVYKLSPERCTEPGRWPSCCCLLCANLDVETAIQPL